ncbi:hypothetical protein Val02_52020 [Virgisporangium aliadipatigenens]|uniref:Uncharacterized protein n=1 Tax=Virgisporangium aliadipatigenens TaxID=741659 RepID=A0A8J3YN66_9ACTN|nr:hypothetical protein [Virgisporangium aliadipatigenens]GIJ48316.1 hypothetical protein Val02_52020 [Virgisporangium aliadipatigenens]
MYPTGPGSDVAATFERAQALLMSFQQTGDPAQLAEATRLFESAVRAIPAHHPQIAQAESALVNALVAAQERDAIDRAIGILDHRLPMLRPGTQIHGMLTVQAAAARTARHFAGSGDADLDEAVRLTEELLTTTPPGSETNVLARMHLSLVLLVRARLRRDGAADLRRSAELLDGMDPDLPVPFMAGLNRVRDMRKQIDLMTRAMDSPDQYAVAEVRAGTPDGRTPGPYRYLREGAADAVADNVEALVHGDLSGLDRTIDQLRASVEARERWDPDRSSLLTMLATMLQNRSRHRRLSSVAGADDDLHEAIRLLEEAMTLPGTRFRPHVEAGLGACLLDRAQTDVARADDLDEGLRLLRSVVDSSDFHETARDAFMQSFADGLLVRSQRDLGADDIDEAVSVYRRLLTLQAEGTGSHAVTQARLAIALMMRADCTGDPDDVRRADAQGRVAAQAQQTGTWRYDAALYWGEWAWRRRMFPSAAEALGSAVTALYRLTAAQLDRAHSEAALKRRSDQLAARAGYAAAAAGRAQQAVAAVETGRAVMLSLALERDTARLDALAALGHADLVRRYREAMNAVRHAEAAMENPVRVTGL